MPDSVIRRVSERFSHGRGVRAKILYFSAKNFGRKAKSGSKLGKLAYSYSTLAHARPSTLADLLMKSAGNGNRTRFKLFATLRDSVTNTR
jgi:hypothetical protein